MAANHFEGQDFDESNEALGPVLAVLGTDGKTYALRLDPTTKQLLVDAQVSVTVTDPIGLEDTGGTQINPATEDKQDDQIALNSRFKRCLKFEPSAGEEVRREETLTDDYHGLATDGTSTATASWDVVRFYKTAGLIVRVRFVSGIAWDDRADSGNWP